MERGRRGDGWQKLNIYHWDDSVSEGKAKPSTNNLSNLVNVPKTSVDQTTYLGSRTKLPAYEKRA